MKIRSIIALLLTFTVLSSISTFAFVLTDSNTVFAKPSGNGKGSDNNPPLPPSCDPAKHPKCDPPPPCPAGTIKLVNGKCETNPPPCPAGTIKLVNGKCERKGVKD
jgi:hypothetical protein